MHEHLLPRTPDPPRDNRRRWHLRAKWCLRWRRLFSGRGKCPESARISCPVNYKKCFLKVGAIHKFVGPCEVKQSQQAWAQPAFTRWLNRRSGVNAPPSKVEIFPVRSLTNNLGWDSRRSPNVSVHCRSKAYIESKVRYWTTGDFFPSPMGSWFPEERLDERCAATWVTGYAAVARLPAVTLLPYLQESSL